MTDTTNHAMTPERIAKLRNQIGLGPDDACDLLDALDALTRELEDAKEDARLWHESEKACSTQFDKLLDENRAQSARIATLEGRIRELGELARTSEAGGVVVDEGWVTATLKGVQG